MEIVHLILGKANPNRMNGVNKVVNQLASRQANAGKKVSVWGITHDLNPNYDERTFETKLFQASKNPFLLDRSLKNELQKLNEDAVIHLHGGWIPIYSTLGAFLKKNEIPFVLTPHGAYNTIAMQRSRIVKKVYFQLFEKSLLKDARKVHSLGESEVFGLNKIFPNTKTVRLPYGFESQEIAEQLGSDTKEFIIGFVGRLDVYTKGLDILISAFEHFQKKQNNTKLWIVGDGEGRKTMQRLIAGKGLQKNVTLWGGKFGAEKDELMKQMTVFAHPSRNEGLPVAVLEAAEMGVPSIVTKATNVSRFVHKYDAGIEIENESVSDLSNAINILFNKWRNDELTLIRENARTMVAEVFNWETIIDRFDKLYES
jgi:glycosyltransferase involved in cell wall biosynthesis